MHETTRRSLLGASAAALASTAGCLGGASGDDEGEQSPSGTATGDHPATTALDAQPVLGDRSVAGLIVGFEDPSCPNCSRFARDTLPDLESSLIGPGTAAFAFRGYPVVYPWGEATSHALEAVYDRDADAFWALKGHYYAAQSAFDADNVLERTRSFLAEETAVDAEAVAADVEEGAYADAVQTDLDAGEAADAGGTPTFFLFEDGEFLTTVSGPQDAAVFESAFGE